MAAGETRVFRPKSLGGLLRLYARNPDAMLYAGGTEIIPRHQRGPRQSLEFPDKVIFLGAVPELARISRSQRFLDIGACLSVSRILSIGRNVLPPVLFQGLAGIGTPSIRNLVTLGGNLCTGGDARAALSVIEAQFELRSAAGTRWVGSEQLFAGPRRLEIAPGEILSRVRVPLEDWDLQLFRKIPLQGSGSHGSLCFAGIAHLPKGSLEALRFCLTAPGLPLVRSRKLEARLKSTRLPIPSKEMEALIAGFRAELDATQGPAGRPGYVKATMIRLVRSFFLRLNAQGTLSR